MLSRRNMTLLYFGLGFAAFFIGIWFVPPPQSFLLWKLALWAVGSIITSQGLLVCLLSRTEFRTDLPVIAVNSALVIAGAILIFCFFIFKRDIPDIPSLRLTIIILVLVGLPLAFLYALSLLSRLPFYRSCTSGWRLWKYFLLFGFSLGSAIFFGMMSFIMPNVVG